MKKMVLVTISGISLFAAGFMTSYFIRPSTNLTSFSENRLPSSYKFINPLLECDNEAVSRDTNLDLLKQKVEVFIEEQIKQDKLTTASVYYRDMNNGPWFGIHEKELFSPASLIKVPLMIAYLKQAESDLDILNKELVNSKEFDQDIQNFTPQATLIPDKKYTVSELINRMIINSDNSAYNILLANMNNSYLVNVFYELGIDISKGFDNPTGDIISVKSYASFFRILYNASYLNKEMSEKALEILNQSQYKDGLVAGIASTTRVAHKYGERSFTNSSTKQLHDCGIVYSPSKPYLICIMSRGKDFSKLTNSIKQISSMVYNYVK